MLLPRALLSILESLLATISTLLDVMAIQVEPSSPDKQLEGTTDNTIAASDIRVLVSSPTTLYIQVHKHLLSC